MSLTIAERFGLGEPLPLHPEDARDEADFKRRAVDVEALIADAVRAAIADERAKIAAWLAAQPKGVPFATHITTGSHWKPRDARRTTSERVAGTCDPPPKDAARCS